MHLQARRSGRARPLRSRSGSRSIPAAASWLQYVRGNKAPSQPPGAGGGRCRRTATAAALTRLGHLPGSWARGTALSCSRHLPCAPPRNPFELRLREHILLRFNTENPTPKSPCILPLLELGNYVQWWHNNQSFLPSTPARPFSLAALSLRRDRCRPRSREKCEKHDTARTVGATCGCPRACCERR